MLRILGAHKIHMQIRKVHPDIIEVLNYLEAKELIEWKYFKDPNEFVDLQLQKEEHRLMQMNVINDCFYKVKNLYEFVVILDFDEVIIPVVHEDRSWSDMLRRRVDKYSIFSDTITSSNVYYPYQEVNKHEDIPKHHYMLQHVQKSSASNESFIFKSFLRPGFVLVAHNHFALKCLSQFDLSLTYCNRHDLPIYVSQLNHYRNEVDDKFKKTVSDTKIWKFKDKLIEAMNETLNNIQYKL